MDLSFSELAADPLCPPGSFVIVDGKVHLDIQTFIGESATSLSDRKVTDLMLKLGRAGHAAQVTVNLGRTTGTRLNCFTAPSMSAPQTINGVVLSRMSISAQGNMAVNVDEISPLLN